mgnify:CR=1 FL=1
MTNILNWEFKLNGKGSPNISGLPLPFSVFNEQPHK